MRFDVRPDRLVTASGRVRCLTGELASAGRDIALALEEAGGAVPGPARAAVADLAVACAGALRTVIGGVDALAVALGAATVRYEETDVLGGPR